MQASSDGCVYVIGDGASGVYHGMAQTAIDQGKIVAHNIVRDIRTVPLRRYVPKKPAYAIPVGDRWAVALYRGITLYGKLGWIARQLADVKYFMSILPLGKAINVYRSGSMLSTTCTQCLEYIKKKEEDE